MLARTPREIVQLLSDIEQRSVARLSALPEQEDARQYWEGLIFALGEMRLAAPLNEVAEILHFPAEITRVPGTHPWVKGVANVRGSLLPIIDLQLFLGEKPVIPDRRCRVLIIRHKGVFSGLLVREVMGMRHFSREGKMDYAPLDTGLFEQFVKITFEYAGDLYPVFSMFALADSSEFQMAAS
ncbi:MAG: chemotaxis protein CheW [Candidatus Polarisedimenticolaceae bacterium]|nr:chemotaxis protein CheW [Candidatus Polarisedimenticolaceae bacterium]